jgi:hypothetical protein
MNLKAEDPAAVDEHVWVPTDGTARGNGWLAARIWWCAVST